VFNEEKLVKVINMVREKKMSCFKAAKFFDVPKTILSSLCQINELSPSGAAITTSTLWSLIEGIFCSVVFISAEQSDAVKNDCSNIIATSSASEFNKDLSPIDLELSKICSSKSSTYPLDRIHMTLTEISIPECKSIIKCEVSPGSSKCSFTRRTLIETLNSGYNRYRTKPHNGTSTIKLDDDSFSLVFPCDFRHVKNKRRKILNISRKAAVIISSMCKNDLIQQKVRNEAPDYADAECMFCQWLFSEDTQGELWIQCLMCKLWAHNDCSGPAFDSWICDCCT
ncbi:hypothetical protein PV326_002227, partial [Microctonus aethiopoides]